MCGIAGLWQRQGPALSPELLKQMAHAIEHRGPDDEGFYQTTHLGLAHRRLSILDLSPAGHQPMSYLGGRLQLVYNGEIYNYQALRQELSGHGHQFHSDTDTEVILAAYTTWGTDCVKHFNGMWAFALWDNQNQLLFCSRDRFGIKPFYYLNQQGCFAFASEIKALLTLPHYQPTPDQQAIATFLQHQLVDLAPRTFYEHISQLLPAHNLLITPESISLERYWDFPAETELEAKPTYFRELLQDSVKLQLQSDVPIGTCLSGGLDSSAIVCLADLLCQQGVASPYQRTSFSACFHDSRFDERPFIRQVVAATGVNSYEVFPSPQQALQDLPALVKSQDEPFGSLSIFAQWCVMRRAQQAGIKVLLDGQGSDEMLAGYGYDSLLWAHWLRTGQLAKLAQEIGKHRTPWGRRLRILAASLRPSRSHQTWPAWLQTDWSHQQPVREVAPAFYQHPLRQQGHLLFAERLNSLLRYEDRNAMAFGIESRVPFLDHRLVEYAFQLPPEALIKRGWSKWILREGLKEVLPPAVCWRTDKMGFVTPQQQWLKHDLKNWVQEILHDPAFTNRPYWQAKALQQAYQNWQRGDHNGIERDLWPIISVELWLRYAVNT